MAEVGSRSIAQEDLRAAAQRLHGAGWDDLEPGVRTEVFEAVVAAELLAMEGVRRGLDREPEIQTALATLRRRELAAAFFERNIWSAVSVSDRDVQTRYREWGSGEELHLAHILSPSMAAAKDVLGALANGASFAALARERSKHAESAPHGGNMGFLRRGMVWPEIASVVWFAPEGQVYPKPIATSMGYHVVEVLARRQQSLLEQESAIRKRLASEKKLERQRAYWRDLERKYHLQWQGEVAARMARRQALPTVQNLFAWRGGVLTAGEYLRRADVPQPIFADTLRIRRLAERLVMEELASVEAAAVGYDTLAVVRRVVEQKRNELMAGRLFATVVTKPEAAKLEQFYRQHRDRYRAPERLAIREILVASRARADSLYAEIVAGADMEVLARRHTQRQELRQGGGLWEGMGPGDSRSATIYRAALAGEGLLKPLAVPGGFAVVRVLRREPGRVLALEEVGQTLVDDYATEQMDLFIAGLWQQYAEVILIDETRVNVKN